MARNERNPNNNQNDLFKALTRMFSGPLTQRRTQSGRQLRRRHLDIYAKRFKSASGQQFKKTEYNPMNIMTLNMISNRNRAERYIDFDQMEFTPEIASSLDIYADEMTTHSALTPMMHIKCTNDEIKYILHNLYYNVMNVEHNLFGWARTMCKYGDLFVYLDIDESKGIQNCIGLPPQEVERLEGEDPTNPNYVQFQWNNASLTLENWQVAHFRVLGNDKHAPYGTSVLDPTTGRVDLRYNPLSIEEDYFIPIRGGQSSTDIVNLPGGQFTAQIEDVKYLRDKLFSALKVPQSYLSMGEGATEDKTTLAQKDIRFARTIQRLQRVLISELEKIGIVHLYTLGYMDDDLLNFKLSLNNPSKTAEMQELEHWSTKFDIAGAATEGFFSRRWISENLLGLSQDEYLRMQREMFTDKKFMAALEAAGQADEGGGDLGGGGGDLDLGGDSGGGDLDLGGDTGEDTAPAGGDTEDNDLLAEPPAKRDDDAKPRGPYKRRKLTYKKGGMKKQMINTGLGETGTARTTFPGKVGFGGLDSLARGVTESIDLEERQLFKSEAEIKTLLESLTKKGDKDET